MTNVGAAVADALVVVVCAAGADAAGCAVGDDTGCAAVNGKVMPLTKTGGL